jgi:rhodanese-related sulfurtransferase
MTENIIDKPLEINVHETKKLINDCAKFFLLDCREPHEYEICNIDGAKLIPMQQIADRLQEIGEKDAHVITYCHHGGRSLRVTQFLREQGYINAQNMTGGIDQWAQLIDQKMARY